MKTLFDSIGEVTPRFDWQPEAPPDLSRFPEIEIDFETTGLQWWAGDLPIGIAVYYGDRAQYLPWGHRGGGNLDEAVVKEWARRELRNKRITNLNMRFEVHMAREWGVDLEAQGNEVSDVGHYAALLDDHRQHFSLDSIALDYLGKPKIGKELDATRMAQYHAGEVAPRAEEDVRLAHELKTVMWPQLDAQDLQRVRALEDQVIYSVCEMEKNGAPIDVELLDTWIVESQQKLETYLWAIAREVGFQVNPDSPKDQELVFQHYQLPIERTKKGAPSFTDAILKQIEHPTVQLMRKAGKLMSLRSKYLLKYRKTVDSKGILRYALHQLRAAKDERDGAGEAGTVTGRFSSSEIDRGVGLNIQQEMKVEKQRVSFGFEEDDPSHDEEIFIIRRLRIPKKGQWLSADAQQIEYRMFASYANNPRVIAAYQENPQLSFHKFVHSMLKPYRPDLTYRRCKDCNFAKIYGAGLTKLALMLGYISASEFEQLRREKAHRTHPKLQEAADIESIYNRELPEVGPLLRQAAHLAMPECASWCDRRDALHRRLLHRGYVQTLLGRRTRFPDGYRIHKALNGVIQGGAADIMKQKLVELHAERKTTGFLMRYTVHDEVDGDASEPDTAARVADILNRQSFAQLRVPILWDVRVGNNWAECVG